MDAFPPAPATVTDCMTQERALVFDRLNAADAMTIGPCIVALAQAWFPGRPVAVHLERNDHPIFVFFMDGTGAGNADWIQRKKNVSQRFGHSSWMVRQQCVERGIDFNAETGLDPAQYRAEGGAVPLVLRGQGRIGTLIVSGLAGDEDHALAVAGLEWWQSREREAAGA